MGYMNLRNKDRLPVKKWDAGLYLRLSRDDDKYESESIASQREILLRFVQQNEDISVYSIYVDDGYTGTNFDRPDFRRMEEDLRTKKINCIIVKDLSRFARNCSEIGNYLSVVFPYLRTRFICINDNVDSYLDPESLENISTKFKNLINEEFCHDISVKSKSALTVRREAGEYIGSFACYGYEKDPTDYHRLIIDPIAAEVVRDIYRMFLGGESIRGIVRNLNADRILPPALYKKQKYAKYRPNIPADKQVAWTQRTVRRILTNQMYIGNLVQNVMNNISYRIQKCRAVEREKWIIVENTHEPIISRSDFNRAAELLERDTRESPTTLRLGVLSGFIKCGDCKRGMIAKTIDNGWKSYRYFICSTYKNRGKNLCSKHTVRADKIEETVLAVLRFHIALSVELAPILELIDSSPERSRESTRFHSALEAQKAEREKYVRLREELYPDYKAGLIDLSEYESIRKKYEKRIEDIEQAISSLEERLDEIKNGVSAQNNFIKEFRKYKNLPSLTREVVCALVENVFVCEDRIQVILKYRDEFETVLEFLDTNRRILNGLNQIQKEVVQRAGIVLK